MNTNNDSDIVVRLYSAFSQDMYSDVPLDVFCEVGVHCNGLQDSNHFLLSLWNEMNLKLRPKDSKYVPWYYRPSVIERNNNWKLVMLGDVHTSFGNFHLMLKMKNKNSIKSVLAYNYRYKKEDCERLFEQLVSEAKRNVNNLKDFRTKVRLRCSSLDNPIISAYSGSNFYIRSERRGVYIDICLQAIDYIEAQQLLIKRLDDLCAFLAVETDLYFTFDAPIKIKEGKKKLPHVVEPRFIQPYIDGPSIRDNVMLLSESGVEYLDKYIFVDRDIVEDEIATSFRRSCAHVYEGLGKQLEKGDIVMYSTKCHNFILSPQNTPRTQNIITMSAMSFLSAIETASLPEGTKETCPTCGNVKYKISARVEDFVSKYLNPETGREFKELYNLRSKFLHAGRLSCESNQITARPFIDPTTGSGLSDYGFITCKVKGQLMVVGIQNIQELTTYVLRCFYQEKMFGITDFDTQDDHSQDINMKHIIMTELQKRMPKGVEIVDMNTL